MIRVLLADDHVLVREGLRALLAKEADIQVVAEAGDGREAIQSAGETRPDVAALDLSMPLLNGLEAARQMAADAMEQLAYQSESSTWRNAYALGAKELRLGAPKPPPGATGIVTPKVVAMLPMGMFFDFLAMRVNAEKAEGLQLRIDWVMEGEAERWKLTLSHSALSHAPGSHGPDAMATVRLDRAMLAAVVVGGFAAALQQGRIPFDGDASALRQLLGTLDSFNPMFNILEP